MLRDQFTEALKAAMKGRDALGTSTVRLILAKLKEQDIEARGKGRADGIDDTAIQQMLQGMIKQRRESITLYEQGKRADLADKERGEIVIIERFLPAQLSEAEAEREIAAIVAATGAASIKDMGKVMAAVRERLAGRVDNAKASGIVKKLLGG
ncbi:MAG TPA: GatB/YqeY domain-containing protein [Stellaceae bacterium]